MKNNLPAIQIAHAYEVRQDSIRSRLPSLVSRRAANSFLRNLEPCEEYVHFSSEYFSEKRERRAANYAGLAKHVSGSLKKATQSAEFSSDEKKLLSALAKFVEETQLQGVHANAVNGDKMIMLRHGRFLTIPTEMVEGGPSCFKKDIFGEWKASSSMETAEGIGGIAGMVALGVPAFIYGITLGGPFPYSILGAAIITIPAMGIGLGFGQLAANLLYPAINFIARAWHEVADPFVAAKALDEAVKTLLFGPEG